MLPCFKWNLLNSWAYLVQTFTNSYPSRQSFLEICWDKTRWAQQHNLVIIWWWLDSDTIKWCLSCSTINSLKMLNNAYRLAVLFTLNYVDVPSTTICLMYEHYFYIQLFKNQLMWQGVWNHKALCLLSFFNHHISPLHLTTQYFINGSLETKSLMHFC